jgi:hypothetical protein
MMIMFKDWKGESEAKRSSERIDKKIKYCEEVKNGHIERTREHKRPKHLVHWTLMGKHGRKRPKK